MVLSFEKIHLNPATRIAVIIKADQILLNAIGLNYEVNIKGKRQTAKGKRKRAKAIVRRVLRKLRMTSLVSYDNLELRTSNFELRTYLSSNAFAKS